MRGPSGDQAAKSPGVVWPLILVRPEPSASTTQRPIDPPREAAAKGRRRESGDHVGIPRAEELRAPNRYRFHIALPYEGRIVPGESGPFPSGETKPSCGTGRSSEGASATPQPSAWAMALALRSSTMGNSDRSRGAPPELTVLTSPQQRSSEGHRREQAHCPGYASHLRSRVASLRNFPHEPS